MSNKTFFEKIAAVDSKANKVEGSLLKRKIKNYKSRLSNKLIENLLPREIYSFQ